MCQVKFVFALLAAWVMSVFLFAAETPTAHSSELATPVRVTSAGEPIHVAGFAAPFYGDINEDGKNDLLVGQLEYGRMQIYLNIGTSEKPLFGHQTWFEAGGRVAGVPTGCAVGFTPQLVDYDGDGRSDIVTGSFQGGMMFVFRRQIDGRFAEAEPIRSENGPLQLLERKYNSTVFVHDWNGDGNHDLLVGRRLRWLPNLGSTMRPNYAEPLPIIPDERRPNGVPCVADWDDNGLPDLIVAGADVVWYRNVGTFGQPKLEFAEVLIASETTKSDVTVEDSERQVPARPYSICATDFNGDGRLDILLGDFYAHRRADDGDKAVLKRMREQRSSFSRGYLKMLKQQTGSGAEPRDLAVQEQLRKWDALGRLPFDGPQAAKHGLERHGGVWFYQRKR